MTKLILSKQDIDLFYKSLENRYKGYLYYLQDRDKFYSIIMTNMDKIDLDDFRMIYNEMADIIFKSNSYIIKNRLNDLICAHIIVIDSLEEYK